MVRRGLVRYGEAVGVWAGLVWRGDAGRSRWGKAGRGQAVEVWRDTDGQV